jgi:hypothetical protein
MTNAGPTSSLAARSNEKKKFGKLVFGSDGTRVLDRGELYFHICGRRHGSHQKFRLALQVAGVWKKFKYCSQCNLIMVERAKWKNFDEVKYCSDKCRNTAKRGNGGTSGESKQEAR